MNCYGRDEVALFFLCVSRMFLLNKLFDNWIRSFSMFSSRPGCHVPVFVGCKLPPKKQMNESRWRYSNHLPANEDVHFLQTISGWTISLPVPTRTFWLLFFVASFTHVMTPTVIKCQNICEIYAHMNIVRSQKPIFWTGYEALWRLLLRLFKFHIDSICQTWIFLPITQRHHIGAFLWIGRTIYSDSIKIGDTLESFICIFRDLPDIIIIVICSTQK